MIPAHSGQLAAIQFSPSGTRIATASDKGTVIRVFSVTGICYKTKHSSNNYISNRISSHQNMISTKSSLFLKI